MNVKAIVIGIMDRLSNYASREAADESLQDRIQKEQEAAQRLLEKLSLKQDEPAEDKKDGTATEDGPKEANGSTPEAQASEGPTAEPTESTAPAENPAEDSATKEGDEKTPTKGIPESIKLYEIFYEQVQNLVNVRAHTRQFGYSGTEQRADFHVSSKAHNLPIQDIIALLVSLANMALKIYPDRLGKPPSPSLIRSVKINGIFRICGPGAPVSY